MRETILLDALKKIIKMTDNEVEGEDVRNPYTILINISEVATKALSDYASTTKEGLRWVNVKDRLPKEGVEVFFDGGENPPTWGRINHNGELVVLDSSGEEDIESVDKYEAWLESPSSAPESGGEEKSDFDEGGICDNGWSSIVPSVQSSDVKPVASHSSTSSNSIEEKEEPFWQGQDYIQSGELPKAEQLFEDNGLRLELTCGACPEQYDVFKQVGYLRLRHGEFRVDFPDCNGETIYEAEPKGDGIFEGGERMKYLTEAMNAILKKLNSEQEDKRDSSLSKEEGKDEPFVEDAYSQLYGEYIKQGQEITILKGLIDKGTVLLEKAFLEAEEPLATEIFKFIQYNGLTKNSEVQKP